MELLVDAYLIYSMHYNEDGGVDIPQTVEQPEASDCFEMEVIDTFCMSLSTMECSHLTRKQTARKNCSLRSLAISSPMLPCFEMDIWELHLCSLV